MQVLQRDTAVSGRGKPDGNESFLLAIDPQTGKDQWRQVRACEAKSEALEAFSTPVPFTHNGRKEFIIVGGDCITGHEPATGKELWRWGTWNPTHITHWRLVPSPTVGAGVILACGPKGAPVYAVKAGGSGTLNNKSLAWQSHVQSTEDAATAATSLNERDLTTDVPTPLFYDGKFYVLNGGKKKLLCVNPADGKVIWSGDLGGKSVFQCSPTAADGKIYMMNFDGELSVVRPVAPSSTACTLRTSRTRGTPPGCVPAWPSRRATSTFAPGRSSSAWGSDSRRRRREESLTMA